MARLTILAAILATILLLVANTYACSTTISTVEIAEAINEGQTPISCREKILCGGYYPYHCNGYILQIPGETDYEMCCTQMRSLDDECHCQALERLLVDLKLLHFPVKEELFKQLLANWKERAQNIPVYCNLKERCRISMV
ncbi:hypothetical protein Q3G72_006279 [Acer saccharum]|nr:hypothetical protein Q3G72_006279 [Acer saccharum]